MINLTNANASHFVTESDVNAAPSTPGPTKLADLRRPVEEAIKALTYTRNQWSEMEVSILNAELKIDDNRIENAMPPEAWLEELPLHGKC